MKKLRKSFLKWHKVRSNSTLISVQSLIPPGKLGEAKVATGGLEESEVSGTIILFHANYIEDWLKHKQMWYCIGAFLKLLV